MNIPITRPFVGDEELEALKAPLASGWLTQGTCVRAFEEEFARSLGVAHAVSCTSCTTALHLALAALDIGPGDEVIVPAFTFVASANAVEYTGARPVFVDIDLDTFNTTAAHIAKAIGPRSRAIMPVHLFGLAADMDPILALARERGLWVVEDAACGSGARYHGRPVGILGDVGCFSFHPRKVITTGEGGMLVTGNARLAELAATLRSHAASVSDVDRHGRRGFALPSYDRIGFNYRMTDLQAAIGVVQLGRLDYLVRQRRRLADRYSRLLSDVPGLRLPVEPAGCRHVYQSYVVLLTPASAMSRDELAARLAEVGIQTRQGTHAVHSLGAYATKYGLELDQFPNALVADRCSLSIPLYPQMTDDEQNHVIEQIRAAMGS